VVKTLTKVVPLADYRLLLAFAGGECRVFDVAPYLARGIFKALRNKPLFDAVRISFDTIAWPNGADFCPEVLYSESQPIPPGLSGIGVAEADTPYLPPNRGRVSPPSEEAT